MLAVMQAATAVHWFVVLTVADKKDEVGQHKRPTVLLSIN